MSVPSRRLIVSNSTKIKGVFDLREAWITELRDEAKVRAIKISTLDNKSDLLKKVHSLAEFYRIMRDNFTQALINGGQSQRKIRVDSPGYLGGVCGKYNVIFYINK